MILFGKFLLAVEQRVTTGWRWRQLPTDGYDSLHVLAGPATAP